MRNFELFSCFLLTVTVLFVSAHREVEEVELSIQCYPSNQQQQQQQQHRTVRRVQLGVGSFSFVADSAYALARFLLDSVNDPAALEHPERLRGGGRGGSGGFDLIAEDLETLDSRLMRALLHTDIPDDWHILGQDGAMAGKAGTHSLTHSLTDSFTHSLPQSLTQSINHSLVQWDKQGNSGARTRGLEGVCSRGPGKSREESVYIRGSN